MVMFSKRTACPSGRVVLGCSRSAVCLVKLTLRISDCVSRCGLYERKHSHPPNILFPNRVYGMFLESIHANIGLCLDPLRPMVILSFKPCNSLFRRLTRSISLVMISKSIRRSPLAVTIDKRTNPSLPFSFACDS